MPQTLVLRNIKVGFATNSSSYHSLIMMSLEEHTKWLNGDIRVEGFTYDEWYGEDGEAEYYDYTRVTPKGEKIVILVQTGYDG